MTTSTVPRHGRLDRRMAHAGLARAGQDRADRRSYHGLESISGLYMHSAAAVRDGRPQLAPATRSGAAVGSCPGAGPRTRVAPPGSPPRSWSQ